MLRRMQPLCFSSQYPPSPTTLIMPRDLKYWSQLTERIQLQPSSTELLTTPTTPRAARVIYTLAVRAPESTLCGKYRLQAGSWVPPSLDPRLPQLTWTAHRSPSL